jgi:hypothetical protein
MTYMVDPRSELEVIRRELDALNDQKQQILHAWEGEKERQNDLSIPAPVELKALNKKLGFLYGQRDAIIGSNQQLAADYGGRKRSALTFGKSPLGSSSRVDKAAKKVRHEANLERRRQEDRARANRK